NASGEHHPNLIDALGNRGSLLLAQGDLAGARADFEECLKRDQKVRGPDHPFIGYDLVNLSRVALEETKLEEALRHLEQALPILRSKLPSNHAYISTALALQGRTLVEADRPAEAEALLEEALCNWRSEFGERSDEHALRTLLWREPGISRGKTKNESKRYCAHRWPSSLQCGAPPTELRWSYVGGLRMSPRP